MNTVNSSQPSPYLPDHLEVVTHPLVHFREPPSFTNCLDILHNCCYLVDLFGYVDLDGDTEGGLSEQAANAFFWQTMAKLWDNNLKTEYDPANVREDMLIEHILCEARLKDSFK